MATALNLTIRLRQDPESKKALQQLKDSFADHIQPVIDAALRESRLVHYARVLVIDDQYLQVLTEFDGNKEDYTEFFRRKLEPVFKAIFSLADGVPKWDDLNNENEFYKTSKRLNLKALGRSINGDDSEGYLFSAYGDATVKQIQAGPLASSGMTPPSPTPSGFVPSVQNEAAVPAWGSSFAAPHSLAFAAPQPQAFATQHPSAFAPPYPLSFAAQQPQAFARFYPPTFPFGDPRAFTPYYYPYPYPHPNTWWYPNALGY